MSELPKGWVETTFGSICGTGQYGWTTKASSQGDVKYLRTTDITKDQIEWDSVPYCQEAPADLDKYQIQKNDILISRAGSVGFSVLIDKAPFLTVFASYLIRFVPLEKIEPYYVVYFLRSPEYWKQISEASAGIALANVNAKKLAELSVPLPPLNEQRRIVAKLDSLFTRSRRAREELGRVSGLVQRYKQAVLAAAFRGDLTADWREENPINNPSSDELYKALLQERHQEKLLNNIRSKGTNRNIPTENHTLPDLPSSWFWATADECSWDLTVGHVGSMKDRYVTNGIPFLRSLNIKPNAVNLEGIVYISDDFHKELKKSALSPGTVVVVRTGEPGISAVIPEFLKNCNCSDLIICRFIQSIFPYFAAYYINSSFSKSIVYKSQVGVAQQHFNVGAMSKLPIPVPPLEEQKEIVQRVKKLFKAIDLMEQEHQKASQLLDRLEQATLAKAFRGELVPQDPNDEPAAALLERIQAERQARPQGKAVKSKQIRGERR